MSITITAREPRTKTTSQSNQRAAVKHTGSQPPSYDPAKMQDAERQAHFAGLLDNQPLLTWDTAINDHKPITDTLHAAATTCFPASEFTPQPHYISNDTMRIKRYQKTRNSSTMPRQASHTS
eukprot:4904864-Pyramimonas_sp.AAC.1